MRPFSLLLFIMLLAGCTGTGTSLGEVRATQPLQTGAFSMPYDYLAACVKARIKTDPWTFGQPVVGSEWGHDRRIVRVYARFSRSTLFEVTFQSISPGVTRADYRQMVALTRRNMPGPSSDSAQIQSSPPHQIPVRADNHR